MRTLKSRAATKAKPPKELHRLNDGPWTGEGIWLDSYGGGNTGVLAFSGHVGRYVKGQWQDMSARA